MERENVYQLALARLTRREYSVGEMRSYLKRKGALEEQITSVIEDLIQSRYLDDNRFRGAYSRSQAARGKGPRAIQMKLRQKGVMADLEVIAEDLRAGGFASDEERAKEILERRYPQWKEDPKSAQRAFQALVRRGFSVELVRRLVLDGVRRRSYRE